MDERWTTRRTTQRLEDGAEVQTYDVVVDKEDGSLGAIVARVHGIDVGRSADVERRARVLAAGPDLIEALENCVRSLDGWTAINHEPDDEATTQARAVLSRIKEGR